MMIKSAAEKRRQSQRGCKVKLRGSAANQILPAHDDVNFVCHIIEEGGHMIGRQTVAAADDKVPRMRKQRQGLRSANAVPPGRGTIRLGAETPGGIRGR